MNSQRLKYLLDRYLDKTATPEERQEFLDLLNDPQQAAALATLNEAVTSLPENEGTMDADSSIVIRNALMTVITQEKPALKPQSSLRFMQRRTRNYAAAAILFLLLSGLTWWLAKQGSVKQPALSQAQRFKNEVAPGHNGAVLTLSNGQQITLDSAGNGVLAKDGEMQLVKKEGTIAYAGASNQNLSPISQVVYNNITTSKGQQWQLTLNDGTKVWLNAASSIHYPVAFTGSERTVEIKGEAYFEVAKDPARPFRVKVGDQLVEVLGTSFNVNAYADEESIKTTLLEGRIKMQSTILSPGQEIQIKQGSLVLIKDADTEQAVAWKNGFFQFDNADIQLVMRQLSRWYNVDVHYQAAIPKRSFGGAMQRSLPLSKVLRLLEENNIKFTIEGNRLTVLP